MKVHHLLLEQQIYNDPIYKDAYRAGRLIFEEKLNAQQIDQIFRAVADGAAKGLNVDKIGNDPESNRTFLGKTADVMSAVNKAFQGVKDAISKSGPVSGMDTMFDSLQGEILAAAGGEKSKVANAIQAYRKFSEKHKFMKGAVKAIMIALAGIATGGLGGVAIVAGIALADRLLMGDKLSSAIWNGFKAGAISYGIGQIAGAVPGGDVSADDVVPRPDPGYVTDSPANIGNQEFPLTPSPGVDQLNPDDLPPVDNPDLPLPPDMPTQTIKLPKFIDSWVELSQHYKVDPDILAKLNPENFGPDGTPNNLMAGQEIVLPRDIDPSDYHGAYSGNNSLDATNILNKINQTNQGLPGGYSGVADAGRAAARVASDAARARAGMNEERSKWIDKEATVRSWYLNECLGKPKQRSLQLTEAGVSKVFEQVAIRSYLLEAEGEEEAKKPGLLSRIGGAIGRSAKKGWQAATNKITYEKLGMEWRKMHPNRFKGSATTMTSDTQELEEFLRSQDVKDGLIQSVYDSMGLSTYWGSGQADPEDAAAADNADSAAVEKPAKKQPGKKAADAAATTDDNKVGDANDLIRDLEADRAKKSSDTASTPTTRSTTAPATNKAASGGASYASGGAKADNPFAYDYSAAAKMAGIKPAAAKPDYSKTMPGYSSQKMTMKMPTAKAPAAAPAPTPTGQLGPRGVAGGTAPAPAPKAPAYSGPYANQDQDDKMNYRGKYAPPEKDEREMMAAMGEQRRMYGGKYIRESSTDKLMREFEHFLKGYGS